MREPQSRLCSLLPVASLVFLWHRIQAHALIFPESLGMEAAVYPVPSLQAILRGLYLPPPPSSPNLNI